ncbi:MAG: hypothetical protein KC646_16645 [Candidatus Cloacimonetes bacterium]|nr:hypothetical protein [Candidatus Cloacimonadota bacterium]
MKRFIYIFCILVVVGTCFSSTKNTKHDFGCAACHDIHKAKAKNLWATPLKKSTNNMMLNTGDAMCYTCHGDQSKGGKYFMPKHSHPVSIVPSKKTKIPKILGTTYIEGVGRVITCTSCHDPHSSNKMFLKIPMKNDALCRACHVSY